MRKASIWITIILATLGMFTVLGCGGGGGGSESVNYTGETMAAVIDTTSAVDLALDATLGTADSYDSMPVPLSLAASGTSGILQVVSNPVKAFAFAQQFLGSAQSPVPLEMSAQPLSKICDSARENGVEGYVDAQVCIDTGNPDWMKLDLNFVGYSDGVSDIDGRFIIEGTEFDLKIIFRDLVTQSAAEDAYIDGWVDYNDNTSGQIVTINYNLALIDAYNGDAFWLDDYVVQADYGNDEVTLSGNFYDFDNGFVSLTTETVLNWDLTMDPYDGLIFGDYPTGGTVKLTGADNHWISITFTPTGYYVEVNYTGDDAADIQLPGIGEYPWI